MVCHVIGLHEARAAYHVILTGVCTTAHTPASFKTLR